MSAFRLTSYQQSFADEILAGKGPSDAMRASLYKTDAMKPTSIKVNAQKLLNHANIKLTIERGRKHVQRNVEYGLERAVEMAMDDWAQAKELGQIGAAVSANRLAADLLGLLIERKRDLSKEEDPVKQIMDQIAGNSRYKAETTH